MTSAPQDAPRRWTPETIRAATPFPKPQGAIDKTHGLQSRAALEPAERTMLRRIAEEADLIDAGSGRNDLPRFWLLVPAHDDLIDFLATFEIERGEDMGVDDCREADSDDEPDDEDEPDDDCEPGPGPGPIVTEERRQRHRRSVAGATAHCGQEEGFRLLRVHRAGG